MRRTKPVTRTDAPRYPDREQADRPACDADRRRFLRQIAAGTGVAMVGLPQLAHGQSLPVDFSKLAGHTGAAIPAAPVVGSYDDAAPQEQATFDARMATEEALSEAVDSESEPLPNRELEAESEVPAQAGVAAALVTENRALWVEPGYLVLVNWSRPGDNESPVAALEGSADTVRAFLESRVDNVDNLHNLEQLHPLERDLVTLLRPIVAPAEIAVLHLDHNCTVVCSALNPSRAYPEIYDIDGEMPAPGWE